MNKNVRLVVNTFILVIVPLFLERNRIKEHPDMQKLGHVSKKTYSTVKDTTTSAAGTAKDFSTSIIDTSKSAYDSVSSSISKKRHERQHNKEIKDYQKSLKEEEKLREKFLKEKESHKESRVNEESKIKDKTIVPKIFKSNDSKDELTGEDKSRQMGISSEHIKPKNQLNPEVYAHQKSNYENLGIAESYDENQENNRMSVSDNDEKRLNLNYSHNDKHHSNENSYNYNNEVNTMLPDINTKVKSHRDSFESLNDSELHKKHKAALDPMSKGHNQNKSIKEKDSLFNKHRQMHEENILRHGRKKGFNESRLSK